MRQLNNLEDSKSKMSFIKTQKLLTGALALILVAGMASPAFALTIDSFNVGDVELSTDGPAGSMDSQSEAGLDGDEVLGGERDAKITWVSGSDNDQTLMADSITFMSEDTLSLDTNAGVVGLLELTYGPGLGTDLTQNGGDRILVDLLLADLTGGTVTVTIMDDDADTATVSESIVANANPNNAQTLTFLFSDFVADNGSIDLDEVDKIEVALAGTDNGDYVIDLIGIPQMKIGGTVGSMSTTSLLVAGVQANMGLWSLALVGVVAAGAAIVYKKKSNKPE